MAHFSLVLVDDNIADHTLVRAAVEQLPLSLSIQSAVTGTRGLELIAETLPDMILLDCRLPDRDGLEILKELKSRPGTREIPVVMVTVQGRERDRKLFLENGAHRYLEKPMDFTSYRNLLLGTIQEILVG